MPRASDISEERVVSAILAVRGRHGVPHWATLWDVQEHLKEFPPKVVLAKLKRMVKSGRITGCTCGCRGDFEV